MMKYNDWLCKFNEIWKNKESHLAHNIKFIAGKLKTKTKKMAEYGEDLLGLGILSVPE